MIDVPEDPVMIGPTETGLASKVKSPKLKVTVLGCEVEPLVPVIVTA